MKLKTRRFIATTAQGITFVVYAISFISIIFALIGFPALMSDYTGNNWWMLLMLIMFPVAVGVFGAITEAIVNDD